MAIALSCGEPAGIGPEIAVAAWQALRHDIPLIWIGDPAHLPAGTPVQDYTATARHDPNRLMVRALDLKTPRTHGRPDPAHAPGIIRAIELGVQMVSDGATHAICTAPIHKAALIDGADFAYPGHTEFLAHLAGSDRAVMMLACDMLRVVPTTIHIALSEVPRALTPDLLRDTIRTTHSALIQDFGIATPRIAVAGLNPHAGEDGKMGREELEMITPVLDALRGEGITVLGPMSADTMFHAGARAAYDVAVCMYHDQALIPIKTLDFSGGVNVTLGLPFIRTSPDHGTAFDIAGTGKADPTSMIAAIKMAHDMAQARGLI